MKHRQYSHGVNGQLPLSPALCMRERSWYRCETKQSQVRQSIFTCPILDLFSAMHTSSFVPMPVTSGANQCALRRLVLKGGPGEADTWNWLHGPAYYHELGNKLLEAWGKTLMPNCLRRVRNHSPVAQCHAAISFTVLPRFAGESKCRYEQLEWVRGAEKSFREMRSSWKTCPDRVQVQFDELCERFWALDTAKSEEEVLRRKSHWIETEFFFSA